MKLIAQGAEAKIYESKDLIIKKRIKKSYRIDQIDDELRKKRSRKEAKILKKLEDLQFPSPRVTKSDDETIWYKKVVGKKLSDVLEKKDYQKILGDVGKSVAFLHNHHVVHGDLTTSNMILQKDEVYFIDFGLSASSKRIEDYAVDIRLFAQALESRHHKIFTKGWSAFLKGYLKEINNPKEMKERLAVVQSRGRNKKK